jgi:hypothetical protein
MLFDMNKFSIIGMAAIAALVIGIGSIAIPVDNADAIRDVAQRNQAGDNTQRGLVNAAVGVQANVGGVCVQALVQDGDC